MIRVKNTLIGLVFVIALALTTGCETGFVTRTARTSLASFITGVVSEAVNDTVGP